MAGAASSRLYYLDTMRGVLMLLGVVLHSARPYSSGTWRVNDARELPALDVLGSTLHLFRMPAFFVIAGFFAMYLIGRRPTTVFLRERMRRVVVPLVVMLFSVNVAQLWFLARHRGADTGDFVSAILFPALLDGNLASHLWFLACLAIYFALTAAAAPYLRGFTARSADGVSGRVSKAVVLLAFAAAVVAPLAIAVAGKAVPALHQFVLGLVRLSTVLEYLPFFAAGVVFCAYPSLLGRFEKLDAWVVGLGICAGIGMYLASGHEQVEWKALFILSRSLLAWMLVRVAFWLFRNYADKPLATFRYLSDASYSVYLFHHIVVIVVATWLLGVDASAWLKFLVVLATASLVSLAAYHFLIRRYTLLRYLFNGAIRPPVQALGADKPVAPLREDTQPVADARLPSG